MSKLSNVSCYVTEKISVDSIDISEYITTDNLLQNKKGRVIAEKLPTQKVTRFKKNDILIANIRPYLKKIWQADIDGGASSDVLVVRPNDVIDNNFLYYALTQDSFFEYVMKGSKGTKMPRGDKSQIMNFVIPDLEIDEQIKIGKLLKSIDQKIQINNQINQELEAMAKTLYDYWFVQFDFPDQNGKPYKSSGGKMVYNPELKREIPEGWGVEKLGDVAYLKAGGDKPNNISNRKSKETPIPIYSNGIDNKGLYGYTKKATIYNNSLTVTARGTIGHVHRRFSPFFPIIRLISVTPKEENLIGYIENFLKSIQFENSGSVQQQLTVPQIDKLYIITPENELLEKYHSLTINYYYQVENNEQQNQELTHLRDWLLPMLMNGHVRI